MHTPFTPPKGLGKKDPSAPPKSSGDLVSALPPEKTLEVLGKCDKSDPIPHIKLPKMPDHLRKCASQMTPGESAQNRQNMVDQGRALQKNTNANLTEAYLDQTWDRMREASYTLEDFTKSNIPAIKLENAVRYFNNLTHKEANTADSTNSQFKPAISQFPFEGKEITIKVSFQNREPVGYRPYSSTDSAMPELYIDGQRAMLETGIKGWFSRLEIVQRVTKNNSGPFDPFLNRLAERIFSYAQE